jgi:hypothetical protein
LRTASGGGTVLRTTARYFIKTPASNLNPNLRDDFDELFDN